MFAIIKLYDGIVEEVYLARGEAALKAALIIYFNEQGKLYYDAWCNSTITEKEMLNYRIQYEDLYAHLSQEITVKTITTKTITNKDIFDVLL